VINEVLKSLQKEREAKEKEPKNYDIETHESQFLVKG